MRSHHQSKVSPRRKSVNRSLALKSTWMPAIAGLAGLCASAASHAATKYWDLDASAGAGGSAPSGTWSNGGSNWTTDAGGALALSTWTNSLSADTSRFSAGTDAVGAYSVTVSGTVQTTGIAVEEGTLTLMGTSTPSLQIGASGLSVTSTVNGGLTLDASLGNVLIGANQTWTNSSAFATTVDSGVRNIGNSTAYGVTVSGSGSTIFNGVISNGGGTGTIALILSGTASVTLANTNSYTGNTSVGTGTTLNLNAAGAVSGGTLSVTGTAAVNFNAENAIGGTTALTVNTGAGINFTRANSFSGSTTNNGSITISGATGSMLSTFVTQGANSVIVLDNTAVGNNNNNRISGGINFQSNNNTLRLLGATDAGVDTSENAGNATFTTGITNLNVVAGSGNSATLSFNTITRNGTTSTGVIFANGAGLGQDDTSETARIIGGFTLAGSGTAPLASGINAGVRNTRIVSWARGESGLASGEVGTNTGVANTLMTYTATGGLRPLNPTDEFTNDAIVAGNNTYIRNNTLASTTAAINAIVINGGDLSVADGVTVTNSTGAVLFASSNAIKAAGTTGVFNFGAVETTVVVNAGVTGTLANVNSSGNFLLYGPGTLELAGTNTFTGTLTTSANGTLMLGSDNALGTLTLRAGSGTITTGRQSRTLGNTYSAAANHTLAGQGDLNLTGTANGGLAWTIPQFANPVVNIINTGTISVSGVFSLSNAGVPNNASLGPTLASSANMVITGQIRDFNAGNAVSTTVGSHFRFSGTGASLTIIGNNGNGVGTNSATITPAVGVGFNTVTVGGPGGAGANITPFGGGSLTTNAGSGFYLKAATSGQRLMNNISLGGSTGNDGGTPIGFAGDNDLILAGTYTLGGSVSFPNIANATLTFANTVNVGTSTFTLTGPGNFVFASTGTISGSTGSLAKNGAGTVTFAAGNSLTGTTTYAGGTVILDYTSSLTKRTTTSAAGASLTLGGVLVQLNGGAAFVEQTGGNSALGVGQTRIERTGGSDVRLNLAAINSRSLGGALDVGVGAASTSTANTNGILGGWATFDKTDWAVANTASSAITALASYDSFATPGTNRNVLQTGSASQASISVTSLKATTTAADQSLTLGGVLTVTSGGLMFTGAHNYEISGSSIRPTQATNSELIVHQHGTGVLTISSDIITGSGATAVTKNGTGTLVLAGTGSTFTGGVYFNGGTVQITSDANLGSAAGGLNFNGGTLATSGTFSSARAVTLRPNGGTISVTSGQLTLSGVVGTSGISALNKTGAGTLVLSGPNTYTGPTNVNQGTLRLGSATALGASATSSNRSVAPVNINGGTLDLAGNNASIGSFYLNSGSVTDSVGGGTLSAYSYNLQSGSMSVAMTDLVVPNAANPSNAINAYKTTAGTVTLTGASTYTGNTNVNAGTLLANNLTGSATGTGLVGVSTGAKFGGTGTIAGMLSVRGGTVAAGTSLGTLTVGGLDGTGGGTVQAEINSTLNTADKLVVNNGTAATQLGAGTLALDLDDLGSITGPYAGSFMLIENTGSGALTGYFLGLAPTANIANFNNGSVAYSLNYAGGTGNDVVVTFSSVPEPGTLSGLALATAALMGRRRRRR